MIEIALTLLVLGTLMTLWRVIQKQKQLISHQFNKINSLEISESELTHSLQNLRIELDQNKQELNDIQKVIENNHHAKSIFLNNMSHEFRTPMNGVLGLTHLLLEENLNPKQKEYVLKINSSAKSLLDIIHEILDFSKVEAGRLALQNEPTQIHELIHHVIETTAPLAFDKDLEFMVDLDFVDLPQLLIDSSRLSQILCNLLSNAIKFTDHGYIKLKVNLIYQMDHEIKLRFSVVDGGIGILAEKQKMLFEQVQRLDDSSMRQFGGTGLGLAISRQICRLMGSDIQLNSHLSKGSEFFFDLILNTSVSSPKSSFIPFDKQIFLLEPLDELRLNMDQIIKKIGAQATVFSSIEALLESLRVYEQSSELPHLVLIDESYTNQSQFTTLITAIEKNKIPIAVLSKSNHSFVSTITSNYLPRIFKPLYPSHLYFELTRLLNANTDTAIESIPNTSITSKFQNQKILLVEDIDLNIMVAKEILESMNLQVKVAMNGLDAVEMIQSEHFDLILMDVQMPIMDGYQATRAIRNLGTTYMDIPILAMTANALESDIDHCTKSGMNGHISKPIDPKLLNQHLNNYL